MPAPPVRVSGAGADHLLHLLYSGARLERRTYDLQHFRLPALPPAPDFSPLSHQPQSSKACFAAATHCSCWRVCFAHGVTGDSVLSAVNDALPAPALPHGAMRVAPPSGAHHD